MKDDGVGDGTAQQARSAYPALPIPIMPCYRSAMLKSRIKRRTIESTRAVTRLAEIQTSVSALNDEDLLDLADIFGPDTGTPLKEMAAAEMARRNLSL